MIPHDRRTSFFDAGLWWLSGHEANLSCLGPRALGWMSLWLARRANPCEQRMPAELMSPGWHRASASGCLQSEMSPSMAGMPFQVALDSATHDAVTTG